MQRCLCVVSTCACFLSTGLLPLLFLGIGLCSLLFVPLLTVFLRKPRPAEPATENQPKTPVWSLCYTSVFTLSLPVFAKKMFSMFLYFRRLFLIQSLWFLSPCSLSTLVTFTLNSLMKSLLYPPLVFPPNQDQTLTLANMYTSNPLHHDTNSGAVYWDSGGMELERSRDSGIGIPPVSQSSEETWDKWRLMLKDLRYILLWALLYKDRCHRCARNRNRQVAVLCEGSNRRGSCILLQVIPAEVHLTCLTKATVFCGRQLCQSVRYQDWGATMEKKMICSTVELHIDSKQIKLITDIYWYQHITNKHIQIQIAKIRLQSLFCGCGQL